LIGRASDPGEIAAFLDGARSTMLDADGNGTADALTDGIVILRYLFGFTGSAMVRDAIAPNANRTDPADIEAFLASYMPAAPGAQAHSPLGVTAINEGGGNALAAVAEPQPEPNTSGPASVSAYEPMSKGTRDGIPGRSALIDEASGKCDPQAEAVDQTLAHDEPSPGLLSPDLDDDFITASYRKPKPPSAVDLALLDVAIEDNSL